MPRIDIHARHTMSREAAQEAADELAQDLAEKFAIDYGWDEDTIHFERTGVSGSIKVDGKQIHILAELGFLLSMFKERFESEIRRYLKDHFNCTFKD